MYFTTGGNYYDVKSMIDHKLIGNKLIGHKLLLIRWSIGISLGTSFTSDFNFLFIMDLHLYFYHKSIYPVIIGKVYELA